MLGLLLWVAALKSGIEAALVGIIIAFAIPLHSPNDRHFSPLRETERRLHPWVVLFVTPLFVFLNAGLVIDGEVTHLFNSVSLGIIGGLFVGKQLGIFGASWIAVSLGIAQLPGGIRWRELYGVALLGGIGFTMSLFVTSLAFNDPSVAATAKLAILAGSLLSALMGLAVIYLATPDALDVSPRAVRQPVKRRNRTETRP